MNVAELSKAIVELLNDPDSAISPPPAARFRYVPDVRREDLATRVVSVIPTDSVTERNSRTSHVRTLVVNVAVQHAPDGDDAQQESQIDADVAYAHAIDDFLRTHPAVAGARWLRSDVNHPFMVQQLRELGVMTALIAVTYEVDVVD